MKRRMSDQVLANVLDRYGLEPEDIVHIGECENQVFQISDDSRQYILRLTPSVHRTCSMVLAEVEWIRYLDSHSLPVARAIPFRGSRILEVFHTGVDSYVSAVVFEKAQGSSLEYKNLQPDLIRRWGETLAKMHLVTRDYRPSQLTYSRMHWEHDLKFDIERYIPASQTIVHDRFRTLAARLRKLPVDNTVYGLIHADLNPDNFFIDEGRITVFDFDDCLYAWFLYDVASIFFFAAMEYRRQEHCAWREVTQSFLRCFLEGYCRVNNLNSFVWSAWPDLLKLQEFEFYITLHRHPELILVGPIERERLRHSIEHGDSCWDCRYS